jgi:GxxExxY protein
MLYQELSSQVIGAVIAVHRELGPGLLEAPYHNAIYYELAERGLTVAYNAPYPVFYNSRQVGEYFADLVVAGKIIPEVESVGLLTAGSALSHFHSNGLWMVPCLSTNSSGNWLSASELFLICLVKSAYLANSLLIICF